MDDCIFCKIIKGEIPSANLYEDDDVVAFLDIAPTQKGHTLVIPKNHYRNLFDMPEDEVKRLFAAVQKVAKGVKEAVGAEGINIGMNNEPASGQIVFHAHVHIIPRRNGDGLKSWPQSKYEEGEMQQFKEKIVKFL